MQLDEKVLYALLLLAGVAIVAFESSVRRKSADELASEGAGMGAAAELGAVQDVAGARDTSGDLDPWAHAPWFNNAVYF